MNRLENIAETNKLITETVNYILKKKGYLPTESKYHEQAFGSSYSIWNNEFKKHCFRLTWNGRDSNFILEESPYINTKEDVAWADVTIVKFDSKVNSLDYRLEVICAITESLEND